MIRQTAVRVGRMISGEINTVRNGVTQRLSGSRVPRLLGKTMSLALAMAMVLGSIGPLPGFTSQAVADEIVGATDGFKTLETSEGGTLALRDDGTLWAWGINTGGRLGLGDSVSRSTPTRVGGWSDWVSVDLGRDHALGVRADGTLWAWGSNQYGQLGTGTTIGSPTPVKMGFGTTWRSVAAGTSRSYAIRSDGTLWAWGRGWALGFGDNVNRTVPQRLGSESDWVAILAGPANNPMQTDAHSFAMGVRSDGTLWGWGSLNEVLSRPLPGRVGTDSDWLGSDVSLSRSGGYAVKSDGTMWAWSSSYNPALVTGDTDWKDVAVGGGQVLATKSDGTLWAWGSNTYGELGLGMADSTSRPSPFRVGHEENWDSVYADSVWEYQLSTNGYHSRNSSLGTRSDGTFWGWGHNKWSQLGLGDTTSRVVPTQVFGFGAGREWCPVDVDAPPATADQKPVIVCVVGRHDRAIDKTTDKGFGWLRQQLEKMNYHVVIAPAAKGATDPETIDTMESFLAYAPATTERLDNYLSTVKVDGKSIKGRKIILIGHSMGGLIARSYAESWRNRDSGCEPVGIIQLGTPNDGSPLSALAWVGGGLDDATRSLAPGLFGFNLFARNSADVPVYQVAGEYFPKGATQHPDWWGGYRWFWVAALKTAFLNGGNDGAVAVKSVFAAPARGIRDQEQTLAIHTWNGPPFEPFKDHAPNIVPRDPANRSSMAVTTEASILDFVKDAVLSVTNQELSEAGISSLSMPRVDRGATSAELQRLSGAVLALPPVGEAERWATSLIEQLTIPAGGTVAVPMAVEGTALGVMASSSNAGLSASVEREDGSPVSASVKVGAAESGGSLLSASAQSLIPGTYTLKLTNSTSSPAQVGVTAVDGRQGASGQLALSVALPPTVRSGEAFAVETSVYDGESALKGGTLEARVDNATPVGLSDDGVSPDRVADDGVYSGTLIAPASGAGAAVSVVATGTSAGGNAYRRAAAGMVDVIEPRATMTGVFDVRKVANASGKVTHVAVDVAVSADETATLAAHADLYPGDGAQLLAQGNGAVAISAPGPGVVTVQIPVESFVTKLDSSGEFMLGRVTLADTTDGASSVLGTRTPNIVQQLKLEDARYIDTSFGVRGGSPSRTGVTVLEGNTIATTEPILGVQVTLDGINWVAVPEPAEGWGRNKASWDCSFNLTDGTYAARARALGATGVIAGSEETALFDVEIDADPPVGTMSIAGGAQFVRPSFKIESNVTGATEMRIRSSNDGTAWGNWSDWSAFSPSIDASVASTSQKWWYQLEYRDEAGNVLSLTDDVMVDATAPVTVSDAKSVYSAAASIKLTASDGLLSGVKKTEWRLNGGTWNSGTTVNTSARGVHRLEFRSTDMVGNVESAKSSTLEVRHSTALALTSTSASSLGYGSSFSIAGALSSGGRGVSGQRVILQSARPGSTFADTGMVATTGDQGKFTFSVKPTAKMQYRVRFAGSTGYQACGPTAAITATPRVSLGAPVAPRTMKSSKSYTVYGSLKPGHTSGTKPVRIYKYKQVGNKWVKKGYVTARAHNYQTYTRYKVSMKLTSKGKWRLRAYAPADSLHAATWSSGYDYVTVK